MHALFVLSAKRKAQAQTQIEEKPRYVTGTACIRILYTSHQSLLRKSVFQLAESREFMHRYQRRGMPYHALMKIKSLPNLNAKAMQPQELPISLISSSHLPTHSSSRLGILISQLLGPGTMPNHQLYSRCNSRIAMRELRRISFHSFFHHQKCYAWKG